MSALPKIVLKRRRALPFFSHHPWVFAGAVDRVEGDPAAGAEVTVASYEGKFIARGLFNPDSNIRVRLYTWNENQPLDESFWSDRLDAAIAARRNSFNSFDAPDGALRLVFSESDGISGLTVDRFGGWLVTQFTSRALADRRELILNLLQEKLQPSGIWLRTERGIGESEGLELSDGLLRGEEPPRPIFIEENGVRFGVDLVQGQKTGFYLDQRDNRVAVAKYVAGHRVLDVFCYSGGFGITAIVKGNAEHVLGIDVSEAALKLARANADFNSISERMQFENENAFDALERLAGAGEKFDTVILDPPKMARHRAGLHKAARGYHSLNRLALDVLKPGGKLVTCSCSGHVTREDFEQILAGVALDANRRIRVLEARGQAADHAVSLHCPENAYLKCYICHVE